MSHLGIVKKNALSTSWRPGMDKEIKSMIQACNLCQKLQNSMEKSLLIAWRASKRVQSTMNIDYARCN